MARKIDLTHKLRDAGRLMGIELLDHGITGEKRIIAAKEKGFRRSEKGEGENGSTPGQS